MGPAALICFLTSQALFGWTRECEYECVDTTVSTTVSSEEFCPLSISYDDSTGDIEDDED